MGRKRVGGVKKKMRTSLSGKAAYASTHSSLCATLACGFFLPGTLHWMGRGAEKHKKTPMTLYCLKAETEQNSAQRYVRGTSNGSLLHKTHAIGNFLLPPNDISYLYALLLRRAMHCLHSSTHPKLDA